MRNARNRPAGHDDTQWKIEQRESQIEFALKSLREEWAAGKYAVEQFKKNQEESLKGLTELKNTWASRQHSVDLVPTLEARIIELNIKLSNLEGQISPRQTGGTNRRRGSKDGKPRRHARRDNERKPAALEYSDITIRCHGVLRCIGRRLRDVPNRRDGDQGRKPDQRCRESDQEKQ